ncbi:hypothetical protein JHK85_004721 [Glycine max]|nr:hypothetical protein JHK85_004721 [Glycine max]
MSAIQIWSVYLTWDIIFASIAPKDIQFFPYQPQIFARQFGHCQLPSVTIYRKKTHRYQIQGDESLIPKVIEKGTPKVKLQFQPSSFVPKIILRDFHLWWKKCYSQRLISILSSLEKLIKTCCSVQDTSKKIKAIPIKIPHQGEAENWEDDDETCTSKKTSRKRKVPLFVNTGNKDVNVEDHSSSQDYSNLEDDKYHLRQFKEKIAKLRTQLLEPPKLLWNSGNDLILDPKFILFSSFFTKLYFWSIEISSIGLIRVSPNGQGGDYVKGCNWTNHSCDVNLHKVKLVFDVDDRSTDDDDDV